MRKLNKSLLTAAVVGALALPGMASAATFNFDVARQITFAKDLFVNDTISVNTPIGLTLTAEAADNDANRITNITALEALAVKITLDNGAQFDSTANPEDLVKLFLQGQQTGGAAAGTALGATVGVPGTTAGYIPGTANYNGGELNFRYVTVGAGNVGAGFFLKLDSTRIKNLIQGLFTGSAVRAEITVQNAAGVQVLAAGQTIARSAWGVTVTSNTAAVAASATGHPTVALVAADANKTIDVGATATTASKTRFSSNGTVGLADSTAFNAGGFVIDITKAGQTSGAVTSYVNNYSITAVAPAYNIVNTAVFTLRVAGSNLAPWATGTLSRAWVSNNAACTTGAGISINAGNALNNGDLVFTLPTNSPIFSPVTAAPPTGGVALYVCLGTGAGTAANPNIELVPQSLSGSLSLNYNLSTQRVNPAPWAINLLPLRLNGSTFIFQNVNPAGNTQAVSFLRITNNTAIDCPVVIDAKDDAGKHTKEIKLTLAAHASTHLNSEDMENGNAAKGLTGSWGDGEGRWYVRVTGECGNMNASALNRNTSTGVVTDLTPQKTENWMTPTTML